MCIPGEIVFVVRYKDTKSAVRGESQNAAAMPNVDKYTLRDARSEIATRYLSRIPFMLQFELQISKTIVMFPIIIVFKDLPVQ